MTPGVRHINSNKGRIQLGFNPTKVTLMRIHAYMYCTYVFKNIYLRHARPGQSSNTVSQKLFILNINFVATAIVHVVPSYIDYRRLRGW